MDLPLVVDEVQAPPPPESVWCHAQKVSPDRTPATSFAQSSPKAQGALLSRQARLGVGVAPTLEALAVIPTVAFLAVLSTGGNEIFLRNPKAQLALRKFHRPCRHARDRSLLVVVAVATHQQGTSQF
jgi:hypothetical protein